MMITKYDIVAGWINYESDINGLSAIVYDGVKSPDELDDLTHIVFRSSDAIVNGLNEDDRSDFRLEAVKVIDESIKWFDEHLPEDELRKLWKESHLPVVSFQEMLKINAKLENAPINIEELRQWWNQDGRERLQQQRQERRRQLRFQQVVTISIRQNTDRQN
jgi:hypothetical protein